MAGSSEKLEIDVTAKDSASKVIDPLVKKVDKLEKAEATIEVDADTKAADRDVDTFAKRLEKLTAKDQKILLSMRAEGVTGDIAKIQGDIAKLDSSDPTVDVKINQLGELTGELDKLEGKIKTLDDLEVKPKVDTKNVRQAGEDARSTADTFQTGVGPLRGFTDEMGEAGVAAGTMGNALIDGGEAVQVFGAKLGLSESTLAKISGGFAIAGAAVAVAMIAYSSFTRQQNETAKKTKEATERLLDQSGAIEKLRDQLDPTADAMDALVGALDSGDFKRAAVSMGALEGTVDDLGATLRGIREPGDDFVATMLETAGVSSEWSDALAGAINEGDDFGEITSHLANNLHLMGMSEEDAAAKADELTTNFKTQINAIEELNDQAENNDLDKIATEALNAAKATDAHTASLVVQAEAIAKSNDANAGSIDVYGELLKLLTAEADAEAKRQAAIVLNAVTLEQQGRNAEHVATALEGVNAALDAQATAYDDAAAAAKGLSDQQSAQVDAMGGAVESQEAANASLTHFAEVARDAKANGKDVADAAWDMSKATAANAEKQAEANGQIVTATGKLDAQNTSLLNAAASTKKGRGETLDYIFALNKIPPDKQTEIRTLLDQGKVDEAKAKIDEASVARDVALNADANATQANLDLDHAARDRALIIDADANTSQADRDLNALFLKYKNLDVVIRGKDGVGRGEHGGYFPAGGIAGEAGPEFIKKPGQPTELIDGAQFIPPRTRVTSVVKTRQILSRRRKRYANGTQRPAPLPVGGGMMFTFQQNAPIYGVNDLDRHLERWANMVLAPRIQAGKR